MNSWNCLATGPTTWDHIDIIMAGWDGMTNWLHPGLVKNLEVTALSYVRVD